MTNCHSTLLPSCMARQLLPDPLQHGVRLVCNIIGQFQGAAAAEVTYEPMLLLLQDPDNGAPGSHVCRKRLLRLFATYLTA